MFGIGAPELLVICLALAFLVTLLAIPATLSYIVLKRIPEPHRKQKPELSFLLLIPVFSLVWQFFVLPKIAESLQSYFAERADRPAGDMGASLALWCCICSILGFIPILGILAGLASFVLMIIFFAKVFGLTDNLK